MDHRERLEEWSRVKASDRIQINNILAAACVAILSVLLGLSGEQFSDWMVLQLAAATPLLVTSSLAYAKLSYRGVKECPIWDSLGWITLSLGYIMLINALAIMLCTSNYPDVSWWFVSMAILLFVVYSMLDVKADKKRLKEKGWKLGFYLALIFLGAILPMLAGWV